MARRVMAASRRAAVARCRLRAARSDQRRPRPDRHRGRRRGRRWPSGVLSGGLLSSTVTGAVAGAAGGLVYDQIQKEPLAPPSRSARHSLCAAVCCARHDGEARCDALDCWLLAAGMIVGSARCAAEGPEARHHRRSRRLLRHDRPGRRGARRPELLRRLHRRQRPALSGAGRGPEKIEAGSPAPTRSRPWRRRAKPSSPGRTANPEHLARQADRRLLARHGRHLPLPEMSRAPNGAPTACARPRLPVARRRGPAARQRLLGRQQDRQPDRNRRRRRRRCRRHGRPALRQFPGQHPDRCRGRCRRRLRLRPDPEVATAPVRAGGASTRAPAADGMRRRSGQLGDACG